MKINKDFVLRQIAGDYVLVPAGDTALDFNGLAITNEVGAFIWEQITRNNLETDGIVSAILDEYSVDEKTAREDTREFLEYLRSKGILEE